MDEYTADAWHDVLGGYDLETARAAAAEVASRQPFVAPAEIIGEMRRGRRREIERVESDRLLSDLRESRRQLRDPRPSREAIAEILRQFGREGLLPPPGPSTPDDVPSREEQMRRLEAWEASADGSDALRTP